MTLKVAKDFFYGKENVLLLRIRVERVSAPIRFEGPAANDARNPRPEPVLFPHIYGPLNLSAIEGVSRIARVDQSLLFPQFS